MDNPHVIDLLLWMALAFGSLAAFFAVLYWLFFGRM